MCEAAQVSFVILRSYSLFFLFLLPSFFFFSPFFFFSLSLPLTFLSRYQQQHSAELVELHVVEDTRTEEESRVERAEARAALGTMPVSVYSFPEHANQCHDDCGTGSSSSDTHADTG